jgi:sugar O-acyltransferase (sialic acid O-acetyltransferase NeuD family)
MSRELIIFGDGPHAREMADIVAQINQRTATWTLLGFLTTEERSASDATTVDGHPLLGDYGDIPRFPNALFVAEYGSHPPSLPRERMATLVAPSTFVTSTARIGVGCVVYPHCFIGSNAVLDDHVFALAGCVINHDDHLEDHVTLASGVLLAGYVHVEANTYLGQGCTVRESLRIGRGSKIGMGSVVVNDVSPGSVMVGNPARILRRNSDEDG